MENDFKLQTINSNNISSFLEQLIEIDHETAYCLVQKIW